MFAGDHIEYQYQKALTTYQAEVEEANAIEKNLLEKLSQNQTSVDNEFKIDQAQKPQVLTQTQLFSRLDALEQSTSNDAIDNEIINNIVNQIDKQNLDTLLTQITQSESNLTNNIDINGEIPHGILPITRKKSPDSLLQPWFLDGFLKIHLDHYLYITADFNLYNQDPIETISDNGISDEVKLINFSQNRRVITGEIHYFDHPYIGMVIQIRRFDPTQPEGERVSQAIR
nr:CsiV family protein [Colwellia maritima]